MKAFCPDCLQIAPFVSKFNKKRGFPAKENFSLEMMCCFCCFC